MPFCLSREELEKLISVEIEKSTDLEDDEFLALWIENARNWSDQLIGLAYFLSKIFEKKLKEGRTFANLRDELDKTYQLQNSMWFVVQEFDPDFINYILGFERDSILSLEDQLIQLQNKLSRHEYG